MSALGVYRRAFVRGAQWRYLALYVLATMLPALLVFVPAHRFFASLFDQSTRSREIVSSLDSSAFFEVLRQLFDPTGTAAGITPSLVGAVLVSLAISPALAGAAATVAHRDAPVRLRDLLGGAGSLYPRMLRMAITGLLPNGVAFVLAAIILRLVGKANDHALLEASASRNSVLAWILVLLLFWLAQSTVEMGRAVLVAEPERRSALKAWGRGVRLLVRRPRRVLGLCLATTVAALLLAALFTAVRLRLPVSGATMFLELLVAQAAVASVGWGRASRLAGLVEVATTE
jgi:hypothetical protein